MTIATRVAEADRSGGFLHGGVGRDCTGAVGANQGSRIRPWASLG